MSTEIAQRQSAITEWSDGFKRLVTETVLRPKNRSATTPELALLAEQAVRTGLDPMARQIYGIYRWDSRAKGEVMTIQVAIDGLRTVAQRTGQYAGGPANLYAGADGKWTDLWLSDLPPLAAKAVVRKVVGGTIVETEAVALWREYVPMKDGKPLGLWPTKPAVMIGKCAEALALRKAFPQDLSGLYTDDEMAQADVKAPPVPIQVSAPIVASPAGDATPLEPEPVDAVVVADRGEDALAARAQEAVKTGRLRNLKALLVKAGAQDTSSVAAALRSLSNDKLGEVTADIEDALVEVSA